MVLHCPHLRELYYQHDALDALIVGITSKNVNFILMGWMPPPDGITMCHAGDE